MGTLSTSRAHGGHGALTMALCGPARFRSVFAFAPIVTPSLVARGARALGGCLFVSTFMPDHIARPAERLCGILERN